MRQYWGQGNIPQIRQKIAMRKNFGESDTLT